MKQLRRVLSLIVVLAMAMSISAFAAVNIDYYGYSEEEPWSLTVIETDRQETLGQAFGAVSDYDGNFESVTMTLDADAAINEVIQVYGDVTLDLAGNTVTNNVEDGRAFTLNDGADFTIDANGGKMVIPETNENSYGFFRVDGAESSLTLNGGTYTGDTSNGAFIRANNNVGATVNLNDVTAETNYRFVASGNVTGSELNVTGGRYDQNNAEARNNGYSVPAFWLAGWNSTFDGVTIESEIGSCVEVASGSAEFAGNNAFTVEELNTGRDSWNSTALAVSNNGYVEVYGGNYNGGKGYGTYIFTSGGYVIVYDGTFTGEKAAVRSDFDSSSDKGTAQYTLYDGEFNGPISTNGNANANIIISGGEFANGFTTGDHIRVGEGSDASEGNKSVSADKVTKIELSDDERNEWLPVQVEKGSTHQLDLKVYTMNAKTDPEVEWTIESLSEGIEGEEIVSIDKNGVVTALKSGVVMITASAGEERSDCVTLRVFKNVYLVAPDEDEPIRLDEADADLSIGFAELAGVTLVKFDTEEEARAYIAQRNAPADTGADDSDTVDVVLIADDAADDEETIEEEATPLAALPEGFEVTEEAAVETAVELGIVESVEEIEAESTETAALLVAAVNAVSGEDVSYEEVVELVEAIVADTDADTVTYEELATVLYNLAAASGYDVSVDEDAAESFTVEALAWAVSVGLIDELTATVGAGTVLTQAQLLVIIARYAELTK